MTKITYLLSAALVSFGLLGVAEAQATRAPLKPAKASVSAPARGAVMKQKTNHAVVPTPRRARTVKQKTQPLTAAPRTAQQSNFR